MFNFKEIAEKVLNKELSGIFVLRNGDKVYSSLLKPYPSSFYSYMLDCNLYTRNGHYYNCYTAGTYDIINFIPDTNMKKNELTIEIPEGKIVDWDESKKQNKIVFKDKQLTYEDVCKKLFNNNHYSIAWEGYPIECCNAIYNASNATTERQLECILAKNKLANVAKYLNDGWKPTISTNDFGHFIFRNGKYNNFCIKECDDYMYDSNVLFKTRELAQQAIEILGEETVKLALEPLGI